MSVGAGTLASFGEPTTLRWSGSNVTGYGLIVSPGAGVKVNGSAYTGPVDLGTNATRVRQPFAGRDLGQPAPSQHRYASELA